MQEKQFSELIRLGIAAIDLCLMAAAFQLAYTLRADSLRDLSEYIWLFYFSAPLTLFFLLRYGVLVGYRLKPLSEIVFSTIRALIVVGIVSSAVLFLSKSGYFSRMLFGYYFTFAAVFILAAKFTLKLVYNRHLRRGGMNLRVALIGYGEKIDRIGDHIAAHPEWGIRPVVSLDSRAISVGTMIKALRDTVVDEVYVSIPADKGESTLRPEAVLEGVGKLGLPIRIALNYDEPQVFYAQQACNLFGNPAVVLAPHSLDPDKLLVKRGLDILGAVMGLVISGCLLPVVALLIKLDSPGPVFFVQRRIGKAGREFRIFKFRTMYADAEARKSELLDENIHSGPIFKVENDPRITRVGRVLRKYSVDECPQFWNVLIGDMSLVGTRPPTPDEVAEYEDHHFRRITMRPGLTGLWQVSGRNSIDTFDDIVALDIQYIRDWNIWLDLRILARTVFVVFFPGTDKGI
jgi:exopolysaccharide biosynthesis polyprenyl glycosylphosphotransferase